MKLDSTKESLAKAVFKCLDESILEGLPSVNKFGFESIKINSKGKLSKVITLERDKGNRIFKVSLNEIRL